MDINDFADRIINLKLYYTEDKSAYDEIKCADNGYKPEISISGDFIPGNVTPSIDIRITNFYPPSDRTLRDYKFIEIVAGYRKKLDARIEGQVWVAYQETPGPDSITYFQLFIGAFDSFLANTVENKVYEKGTLIANIVSDISKTIWPNNEADTEALGKRAIGEDLMLHEGVRDAIAFLMNTYQDVVIRMDNDHLTGYLLSSVAKNPSNVDFFSSPPKKEAWGFSFVAPWIPSLRPGDSIIIDPKYLKQTFVTFSGDDTGSVMSVLRISFSFSTTGNTNRMAVIALTDVERSKCIV